MASKALLGRCNLSDHGLSATSLRAESVHAKHLQSIRHCVRPRILLLSGGFLAHDKRGEPVQADRCSIASLGSCRQERARATCTAANHFCASQQTKAVANFKKCRRFWEGDICRTIRKTKPRASLDADLSEQVSGHRKEGSALRTALGLGVLLSADQALQYVFQNAPLPSALIGCLLLTSALLVADQASQPTARDVIAFFGPATEFLQRWLPLFYTPALVMLPQVLQGISVVEGAKVVLVLVVGLLTSFLLAGGVTTLVRKVKPSDRLRSAEHMPNVAPYTLTELIPWAALTAIAGLVYHMAPTLAGSEALTAAPCLLGATVTGFLLSAWLPGPLKRLIHPSLVAAALLNAVAVVGGRALGGNWGSILGLYSTGSVRSPGAADLLSLCIGPSILALAFTLNRQKKLIRDHLPEIAVTVPVSALVSLFSAAFLARRLNLNPTLSASLAARFVSPQVAAPLAPLIGGDPTLLVGASVLTGVLGSNLNRWLLSLARFDDPVARALAVSCSSHGLGSAALAAKDEDLLPFAQVAYTLTALFALGAFSTPAVAGQLARLVVK